MKNSYLLLLLFITITFSIKAQNTTFNNVSIGTDNPAYGVQIKANFPGMTEGWARSFCFANENGSQRYIGFGAYGATTNGISTFENGFIGKDWDSQYMTFLPNGYIGIGNTTPSQKLTVNGGHGDSRILLHSTGSGQAVGEADLMLWASEPGMTYTGTGIGNNVHNFFNGIGKISLLNPAKGGSYIRLLDNSMQFNIISSAGLDNLVLSINSNSNVGIGTSNPDSKLTVAGNIHAREVKVTTTAGAVPDYVFANDYKLKSLQEVEAFIKENSHLPEIPSAKEIEKNGLMLAEMNMSLLTKIEELTLYTIEQEKKSNTQSKNIDDLLYYMSEMRKENEVMKKNISELQKKIIKQ